jgi:hypothetical protein
MAKFMLIKIGLMAEITDGVPGAKALCVRSNVGRTGGTTQREACLGAHPKARLMANDEADRPCRNWAWIPLAEARLAEGAGAGLGATPRLRRRQALPLRGGRPPRCRQQPKALQEHNDLCLEY